jgi:hypothetical protein
MIRRDVQLADSSAAWALISQVSHARISAQLASHCTGRFKVGQAPEDIRREVLAAIEHHDDGWAEWERAPQLDVQQRPVSFMELDTAEALAIWTRSVDSAAAHGPLSGWMVAGHFSRLTRKYSDATRTDPQAARWYEAMQQRRSQWLAEWQAIDPAVRTSALADEALEWLWTFDEVSLWFCCTCQESGEKHSTMAQSKPAGQGTPIAMLLQPGGNGAAGASPWRFDAASIDIEAAARIVPARRYESAEALLVAARPSALRWQFMAPIERHSA